MNSMVAFIVICTLLLGSTYLVEQLAQEKKLSVETSRKIPHVLSGIAVAILPFFIGLRLIPVVGAIDIGVLWLLRKFDIFSAVRHVERKTYGEFFFAIGAIITSFITDSNWIFAAAIFYLGFADAAAAIIGQRFGKHQYKIFGQKKSLEGSAAFFVVATVITGWAVFIMPIDLDITIPALLLLPLATTIVEGCMPYGLDNLFLPIIVAGVLSRL